MAVGRSIFEPGWRWSQHVKPIVGTQSCQVHHLGYVVSGHLHFELPDGKSLDLMDGDAFDIPPSHDPLGRRRMRCHAPGRLAPADPEASGFGLLTLEFFLYAVRQPELRAELARRFETTRPQLAASLEPHRAGHDEPPLTAIELAVIAVAASYSLGIQAVLDQTAIPPNLYQLDDGQASGLDQGFRETFPIRAAVFVPVSGANADAIITH